MIQSVITFPNTCNCGHCRNTDTEEAFYVLAVSVPEIIAAGKIHNEILLNSERVYTVKN